ncbi:hypothetical protein A0130_03170 [Leifsonia xyli]|nr:hypothetical protein A0130_03170 [Leifsonia xyli]
MLYVRLSKESALSTSVAGQHDDLTAIAAREGWEVVKVYEDNGLSGGKERAKAQAAFDMVARGDADVLAVYAYDRWSRQGIEKAADVIRLIREREESGRPALFVAEREGIRSDRDNWEMQLAFAADVAKKERDRTRARQIAARDRMRREGRNPGYGTPPLGYKTGPHPTLPAGRGLIVIEEEAEVIREVAERLVDGESTVKIATDLTERGFARARSPYRRAVLAGTNPTGLDTGVWSSPRIRDTWTSDHLLGRVSFGGRPVTDATTGLPLTPFEPILDLDTVLRIRERFSEKRGQNAKRRAARLLSGVAYCGLCGTKMYAKVSREVPYYQCSAVAHGIKCTQPRIDAKLVEDMVTGLYLKARGHAPRSRSSSTSATRPQPLSSRLSPSRSQRRPPAGPRSTATRPTPYSPRSATSRSVARSYRR